MGITIFYQETYINYEHQGNKQVYLNIPSKHQTKYKTYPNASKNSAHAGTLIKAVLIFFILSQETHSNKIAHFCVTAKVIKTNTSFNQSLPKFGQQLNPSVKG